MVFFYRRFLPLDVFIYAFGAENDASSSNLPSPFVKKRDRLKFCILDGLVSVSGLKTDVLAEIYM